MKIYINSQDNSHNLHFRELCNKHNIEIVNNIEDCTVAVINVSIDSKNTFEPKVSFVIDLAKSVSLEKHTISYGFDLKHAQTTFEKLGGFKNEYGMNCVSNIMKFKRNKKTNCGTFFYENVTLNGMISSNEHIINIFSLNLEEVFEVAINLENKNLTETKIEELNSILSRDYDFDLFSPFQFGKNTIRNEIENLDDKTYLIGDDVFFIDQENGRIMKEVLLNNRISNLLNHNFLPVIPFELSEGKTQSSRNLNELIYGNNCLAKNSKSFIANLHTIGLEDSAVDSGSLYEVALSIFNGGFGVIHVDEHIKKEDELFEFLQNENIIVIKNQSNKRLTQVLDLFTSYKEDTKIDNYSYLDLEEINSLVGFCHRDFSSYIELFLIEAI